MKDNELNEEKLNLEKENISIDEKIKIIKENEKFKLNKQGNLNDMIYKEVEEEYNRIKDLNKMLDEEIRYVYSKIDKANRKWILDDFRNYLYKHNDGYVCARIYHHKHAKELKARLKKFKNSNKDKNIKIVIADKIDYRSVKIDGDIDKEKIVTLLKSWVFYSNTTVEYNKTKFFPTDFNKSLMYKVKVAGLMFIAIGISLALCITLIATIFIASEAEVGNIGFEEIFFFSFFSDNKREKRRTYNKRKQSSLNKWFNNLKESLLY